MNVKKNDVNIADQINSETAQISWQELERSFARGVVWELDASLDLVKVAAQMKEDDAVAISALKEQHCLSLLSDETATRYAQTRVRLWAVVIAPYVLVQEKEA